MNLKMIFLREVKIKLKNTPLLKKKQKQTKKTSYRTYFLLKEIESEFFPWVDKEFLQNLLLLIFFK